MRATTPTVLHTIDTTGPGGAETVFLDIAEHLQMPGHQTLALIKGPGWVQDQLDARHIPYRMLKPHGFLSLPYYWQVYRLIRTHRVHLVYAHLLGSALTFSLFGLLARLPAIGVLHGQVDVNPNERFVPVKRWLMKHGLRKVVAVSQRLANNMVDRGVFTERQVAVIHNGIDTSKYRNKKTGALKASLNLDDAALLVGSLGNIRPAKDYANLLNAAADVIQQEPRAHFVIAGHQKEPLMSELSQQAQTLGVQSHVHFIGFIDSTADFLAELDVFALSSSSEGFSIATIEAMASGIPVVATLCGGPEEIIRLNVDGALVPVSKPEMLAQAILKVMQSPLVAGQLYSSAMARVEANFSLDAMLKKYREIGDPFCRQEAAQVNYKQDNLQVSGEMTKKEVR
ncbi:glycosyltransferase family 4 protein [Saccharospirillum impatiens]|uniref:glycosyltransferase family 4 protein n=1 Tax=Saccharospirillum impatiens TaxID=169438 RepID=UPI00041D9D8F|nr:glycosyltransferase family 4 protein [Saccharospirillum impatiens]